MSNDPARLDPESPSPESVSEVELYWNRPTGPGDVAHLDGAHGPQPHRGPHLEADRALDPADLAELWRDLGAGD